MILAGDVGGTKTNLGFFDVHGGRLVCLAEERLPSGEYKSLDSLVSTFISRCGYKRGGLLRRGGAGPPRPLQRGESALDHRFEGTEQKPGHTSGPRDQ